MDKSKINFSYLSYLTIFSCSGTVSLQKEKRPCFGAFLKNVNPNRIYKQHYTITMYDAEELRDDFSEGNNICLFSEDQIRQHIKEAMNVYPFRYTLKHDKCSWIVDFWIEGFPLFHKFILTWFRQLYEWPYCFALYDMYELKKIDQYKNISDFNLFALVCSTTSYALCCSGEDGLFLPYCFYEPMTYDEIRDKIMLFISHNVYRINLMFRPSKAQGIAYCGGIEGFMNNPILLDDDEKRIIKCKPAPKGCLKFGDPCNPTKEFKYIAESKGGKCKTFCDWSKDFEKRLEVYNHNFDVMSKYLNSKNNE